MKAQQNLKHRRRDALVDVSSREEGGVWKLTQSANRSLHNLAPRELVWEQEQQQQQ